jgi:hypothetical protein
MIRHLGLLAFALSLSACAAFPKMIDTLFGTTREPATETPLYTYRSDLVLGVNSKTFDGVAVTAAQDALYIDVTSVINLDRVEFESCARQDVCQNGKNCSSNFYRMDTGWFGKPGQHMIYYYQPNEVERKGSCPIYIRVFDKQALAAWGFLAFRAEDETLQAHFSCNGFMWKYAGHSVCQTKAGLIQQISFDEDIEESSVDESCHITRLNARAFELRPDRGLCTGKFYANGKWHGLDLIAYAQVLVRGT